METRVQKAKSGREDNVKAEPPPTFSQRLSDDMPCYAEENW